MRVVAGKEPAARAAGGRLHRDGLLDLLGRNQRALLPSVSRLSPALAARCWRWGSVFDVRRVTGRWAVRFGGVLAQASPQVIDLLLESLHPPLILLNEPQDRRRGSRRYLVPEFNRN